MHYAFNLVDYNYFVKYVYFLKISYRLKNYFMCVWTCPSKYSDNYFKFRVIIQY